MFLKNKYILHIYIFNQNCLLPIMIFGITLLTLSKYLCGIFPKWFVMFYIFHPLVNIYHCLTPLPRYLSNLLQPLSLPALFPFSPTKAVQIIQGDLHQHQLGVQTQARFQFGCKESDDQQFLGGNRWVEEERRKWATRRGSCQPKFIDLRYN